MAKPPITMARDRQRHVPEVVEHLVRRRQRAAPVVRTPGRAAGTTCSSCRRRTARSAAGRTGSSGWRCSTIRTAELDDVEARAVAHRLGDAERDGDRSRSAGSSTGRARSTPASCRSPGRRRGGCGRSSRRNRTRDSSLIISRKRSPIGLSKPYMLLDALDQLLGQAARAAIGAAADARRRRGRLLHRLAAARRCR